MKGDGMPDIERTPDRCEDCGRFVGFYPIGFYDDRYCADCYHHREQERKAREERQRELDRYAR